VSHAHIFGAVDRRWSGYLHIRHANKLVPTTEARFDPILILVRNLYPPAPSPNPDPLLGLQSLVFALQSPVCSLPSSVSSIGTRLCSDSPLVFGLFFLLV